MACFVIVFSFHVRKFLSKVAAKLPFQLMNVAHYRKET